MSARDLHFDVGGVMPTDGQPGRDPNGPAVALFAGLGADGYPMLRFGDTSTTRVARTIVCLGERDVGRSVLVLFEAGDITRPIVVGVIQPAQPSTATRVNAVSVTADGERVWIEASKEIVLRCGEASITLTRAGKVLIRGAYVSSNALGMNRVTGATVRLN